MAELILTNVASAIGQNLPQGIRAAGTALLRAGAAYLGRSVDNRIFGPSRRSEGPRLTDLHIQGSSEGASIPAIYGRVRIAGQAIWAARFKEHVTDEEVGGGKGGPSVSVRTYRYTLSFAIGLCEGPVARIGRAWANGEPLDLGAINWRLYKGEETQEPDALIEAVEGEGAPAYRGLAYVVFEDLPLERFGNVMPQLSFEIVRPAPSAEQRLETMARGVALIPGSGEFVYATAPVRRVLGAGRETAENVHAEPNRANFEVALDHLAADLPNVENVLLVVSWFGTDLRCGECEIRPGVELQAKITKPIEWRVNAIPRGAAHLVSQIDGAPAYGGTPSDNTVIGAIQALKARGYKVGLYPFVLMDVPENNALPDPYGGAQQAAYPWRGRITLHPAPGELVSSDKSAAAETQMNAFFGAAQPAHFGTNANGTFYFGPNEFSFRRFILHHAKLAQAAGGVDFFVMGSELRGLTTARSGASTYPAVAALKTLASDARSMLGPQTKITYAADWSEYFGHQPQDGSGDVFFHLDPLWSDAAIDAVGIDWYAPLTDWRDGSGHLDAILAKSVHDPDYLEGRIEAGENYDFFYASEEDRAAQTRTPITDGAYGKPWVFRAKDVRSWWSESHFNRPGGIETGSPTDWVPQSKPIWFVELGCPAVDKGANAPNLFVDEKSSESALPPFSSGERDDLIQRRALEAYLHHWDGEIVDPDGVFLWCWDARPHPAFPARADVWSDASSWRRGHWLSGRVGLAELSEVVADLCARAGADVDASKLEGAVGGYVVDAPSSAREAIEPLMRVFDFSALEREGKIVFAHRTNAPVTELSRGELASDNAATQLARADSAEIPIEARVQFLDAGADYRVASVSARRLDAAEGGVAMLDAPLVLDTTQAESLAKRALAQARANAETLDVALSPQALAFEPGDLVALEGETGAFEIARIEDAETRKLSLARAPNAAPASFYAPETGAGPQPSLAPTPLVVALDLPPLPSAEADQRPLAAVFAEPWFGAHDIFAGPDAALLTKRAQATRPAIVGELLWALWPGPVGRWDEGNRIRVRFDSSAALQSVSKAALLNGANLFAIETAQGWEIVQARNAILVGENEYEASGFLRGLQDSADVMDAPTQIGARIVKLDARLARLDVAAHEWGEPLSLAAPPFGALPSDANATSVVANFGPLAARPFAPVHVRAKRLANGDVQLAWIRCARIGGDSWGAAEPPIGEPAELYRLEIINGAEIVRSAEIAAPSFLYSAADQIEDFGAAPSSLTIRVAQVAGDGLPGRRAERTFSL